MGFLLANPNLKPLKNLLKESSKRSPTKTHGTGLNRKSGKRAAGRRHDRARRHSPTVPHLWHSGAASCHHFLSSFALLICISSFSWVFARLRSLPTKVNKTSENPKDYIIVQAKIRWKGHTKYNKLSPNKYPHTYLFLVLKQNKRKTNRGT